MKNIPLKYKIILGLVLTIIILIAIKPNIAKKLYKKAIGDYNKVDEDLKGEIEKLKKEQLEDSIYYEKALKLKEEYYEEELIKANEKYFWLTKKYKQNEKELDTYRHADFDSKFELFSIAIIGKDTISR